MELLSAQIVGLLVVLWSMWRLLRILPTCRSPLRNIPGPPPYSRLFGHFPLQFDRHGWEFHDGLVDKPVTRLDWFFGSEILYVTDPRALEVMLKNDVAFEVEPFVTSLIEHLIFWGTFKLIFGHALLGTVGEAHRHQRRILNPVFSVDNLRELTPYFHAVSYKLKEVLQARVQDGPKEVDLLAWMGRTALELIGQGGLGYSFDPLVEDVPNKLGDALKNTTPTLMACGVWRIFTPIPDNYISPRLRKPLSRPIPDHNVHDIVHISDVIDEKVRKIFSQKKAMFERGDDAIKAQVGGGKDIVSILLKASAKASAQDQLPEDDLVALMSQLVFAATDTTSNSLAKIFHLLSENQDIHRLRKEIVEARKGGDLLYEEIMNLRFLDAVCRETLRLFPPVVASPRVPVALEETKLPLMEPIRGVDGTMMQEIPVPKGTTVFIGIRASNRSTSLWGPDVAEWKPERWLSKLAERLVQAKIPGVYSHLTTFIGGGRACIGFRYSQLETKIVLSVLLESFKVSPAGNDIVWNIADVTYPSIGPLSTTPTLPLVVEPL